MIHVYQHIDAFSPKHRAIINKQDANADGYRSYEPWLLLHDSGRIDRFQSLFDARMEARKTYCNSTFSRS